MKKGVVWAVCAALAVILCVGGRQGNARAEECKHETTFIYDVRNTKGLVVRAIDYSSHELHADSAEVLRQCLICSKRLDYREETDVTYTGGHRNNGIGPCDFCNDLKGTTFHGGSSAQGICVVCGHKIEDIHLSFDVVITPEKLYAGDTADVKIEITNKTSMTFKAEAIHIELGYRMSNNSIQRGFGWDGNVGIYDEIKPNETVVYRKKGLQVPAKATKMIVICDAFDAATNTTYRGHNQNPVETNKETSEPEEKTPEPQDTPKPQETKPSEQEKDSSTWEEWFEFWKEKFPDRGKDENGKDVYHYWNHEADRNHSDSPQHANHVFNTITSIPCDNHPDLFTGDMHCNDSGKGSWQCQGFVDMLTKQATGEYCSNATNGWKATGYTNLNSFINAVSVGDVIKWPGHWAIVTSVEKDRIGTLECNYEARDEKGHFITEKFCCIICRGYRDFKTASGWTKIYQDCTLSREPLAHNGQFADINTSLRTNGVLYLYHFNKKLLPIENKKEYKIVSASGTTHMLGSTRNAVLRCSGLLSQFIRLLIDGIEVNADDYTLASGSTVVTLSEEYLNTLSVGEHDVTFIYDDGTAETKLYITTSLPQTGDDTPLQFWTAALLLAAASLALLARRRAAQR